MNDPMTFSELATKKALFNITFIALWIVALLVASSSDSNNYARAALGVLVYGDDKRFYPRPKKSHYGTTGGTTYPGTEVPVELIRLSLVGSGAPNPQQSDLPSTGNSVDHNTAFDVLLELTVDGGESFALNSPLDIIHRISATDGEGYQPNTADGEDIVAGEWTTELLAMSIAGEHPTLGTITIRESPTAASLGKYDITDLGDGAGELESFFDIWTEIRIGDATQPFRPAASAVRLNLTSLVPEPSSAVLLLAGLAGGVALRRRRPTADG
jgi:hypothetical protein